MTTALSRSSKLARENGELPALYSMGTIRMAEAVQRTRINLHKRVVLKVEYTFHVWHLTLPFGYFCIQQRCRDQPGNLNLLPYLRFHTPA